MVIIDVEGISQITFCQYYVVVLASANGQSFVVCYDVTEQAEMGNYEVENQEGFRINIRSDNENIYFSKGIQLGKISVPAMQLIFLVDTEHSKEIIEFSVSEGFIVTSSLDSSLRVQSSQNGF